MKVLAFILAVHASDAQIVEEPVEKINSINRGAYKPAPNKKQDCFNFGCVSAHDPEADPSWKQCLAQICPQTKATETLGAESLAEIAKTPEYQSLMSTLHKMFENKLKEQQKQNEYLIAGLKENTEIDEPRAKAFASLLRNMRNVQYFSTTRGKVDFQRSYNTFIAAGGSPDDFEPSKKFFEVFLKTSMSQKTESDLSEATLKDLQPDELKARLLKALETRRNMDLKYAKELELPVEFALDDARDEEMRIQIESGTLTPARLDDLRDGLRSTALASALLKLSDELLSENKNNIHLRDVAPKNALAILESEQKAIASIQKGNLDFQQTYFGRKYSEAGMTCANAIALGYAMAPSAKDLEAFAKTENEWRKDYVQRLSKLLSAHSAKLVENLSREWKRSDPATKEVFLRSVKDRVKNEIDTRSFDSTAIKSPKARQTLLVAMASRESLIDEDTSFNSEVEMCKTKIPRWSDARASLNQSYKYNLSPRAILNPRIGRSEAFHEYSHLLSDIVASHKDISKETAKWYKELRECLDENKNLAQPRHTEEDFAELITKAVDPDQTHYLCDQYFNSSDRFTLNDEPFDSLHSSAVYTFMSQMANTKTGIAPVCREAFRQKGITKLPENCFAKVGSPASKGNSAQ